MDFNIPSDVNPGPFGEVRAASTAAGGTALTTTAQVIGLPNGTAFLEFIARNFATAAVVQFALNPFVSILRTDNGLGTETDFSSQGQQIGGTGITLNTLATLANGGALYVGSHVPFRGLVVDMSASVNAVASVLSGFFWNGAAWVTASITDGTASGGATFAQDGNITWTVPATWAKVQLHNTIGLPANQQRQVPYGDKPRFWMRFSVTAALSAVVLANTFFAMNRSTVYGEMVSGAMEQCRVFKGVDGVAAVEALTNAGTANHIVNSYSAASSGGF